MRISWVGKVVINRDMTFAKVLEDRCQINICDITHINYDREWISSRSITEFYKEMLQWFREAVPIKVPECGNLVRKQIIWYNKEVRIDRKTVCYKSLYKRGIKVTVPP